MKKISVITSLVISALFLLSSATVAATGVASYEGKIEEVLMGTPYGTKVIIKVGATITQSDCHTNPNYNYVFDGSTPVGKMMLSAVLTAHSTQRTAHMFRKNSPTCSLFGGIEELDQIVLK